MKRIIILLALLAFAAGCRSIPIAGECPETAGIKCLTGKKCSEDKKRGCQVCSCDTPVNPDEHGAREAQDRGRSPDFP